MGLARVSLRAAAIALGCTWIAPQAVAGAAASSPVHIVVWADRDDDDADGRPDGEEAVLPPTARVDLVAVDRRWLGSPIEIVSGGDHARLVVASGPIAWGRATAGPAWVQGISPGQVELVADSGGARTRMTIDVRGIDMRDGLGDAVDMARSHASLERTPPARVEGPADARYDDVDALRVVMALPEDGPGLDGDREIAVDSVSALGVRIDTIERLPLAPSPCARAYDNMRCWASGPLRLVTDDVDRDHPLVAGRSINAELGGAIAMRADGRKAQMIRVLGPRASPIGPIARLRATLRPFVVRVTPGGAPAIGGTDSGAVSALRAEVSSASAVWGQCGITFGDPRQTDVRLVDPPPSHLVAIGDDLGIPASGGEIRMRIGDRTVTVPTSAGQGPDAVATSVARAAERAGFVAVVSPNARVGPGIAPSVDVSLRHKDGSLVAVDTVAGQPLSTDPTLSVRIGSVDLSDGLQHFTDMDAMAGTLEERTLLKAVDDGDPTTIEVVVVPLFAGGGRIGESFIGSDLSSIRNVVLLRSRWDTRTKEQPRARPRARARAHGSPRPPRRLRRGHADAPHGLGRGRPVAFRTSEDHRRRVRARRATVGPAVPCPAARGLAHRSRSRRRPSDVTLREGERERHRRPGGARGPSRPARTARTSAPSTTDAHCALMTVSCVPPA